jgi:hypothetical protein
VVRSPRRLPPVPLDQHRSLGHLGANVTTVDSYASTNTNRVVMWDKGLLGIADHTIKVVNLGSAGRPRIDVDAYLR